MKNTSCSLGRSSFGTLLVVLLSFLVLSLLVQSCRLNQNVQAASLNQREQSETNRLNLPDREVADNPSFNRSIPQSAIQNLSSTSIGDPQSKAAAVRKTAKLQMPFIVNEGQTDEKVAFYANTFGGTVFVTKDGDIVYSLPNNSSDVETQCLASLMHSPNGIQDNHVSDIVHPASWIVGIGSKSEFQNPKSTSHDSQNLKSSNPKSAIQNLSPTSIVEPKSGVALREEFVGAKVKTIQGEEKSVTKVNYFKGNDPAKWKTDISTYDMVNLGEIYKGIDLKLKAYGSNVEKLFCVKPDANPDKIQVKLSGAKGLRINDEGQLVAETELGTVKFTKPLASQEIDGKRVDVSVEYRVEISEAEKKSSKHKTCNSKLMSTNPQSAIRNLSLTSTGDPKFEYGFKVASYDKTKDLIIDPLLSSTFLGGTDEDYSTSIAIDSGGNIYVAGYTVSSDFPTLTGVYDTSYNNGDAFVSKLNSDLTNLLTSTYLGGSKSDYVYSIVIDSENGNIFVTGQTKSSDFPTTRGIYDSYYNGGDNDTFVSKLSDDLSTLVASTYSGGSSDDFSNSIAIDLGGNIYIAGYTSSSDFPITTSAYDTSYNGGAYDVFVTKLSGDLTRLLTSTYLGGSGSEENYSIAIDSESGNIYVAGYTASSDFPTTDGAYNISYNNGDAFVSKLNEDLTRLLVSTYFGGSGNDYVKSIVIDSSGNIYMTGATGSSDFPTTTGVYGTFYKGGDNDSFVSKLNGDLTSILTSTYLGGSSRDVAYSLAIDSDRNVYVAGETESSNFPTTNGAYDTSYKGGDNDSFILKLNSYLTNLISSTYLGGSDSDSINSLIIGHDGNIYVTGLTYSSNFPTNTDVYDTSYNGSTDIFVSKFDSDLSASPPTVTTGSVANLTSTSASLNGTVNANGLSATVWFEYSTTSKSYNTTLPSQIVSGWDYNTVSNDVNKLSPGTTYYYALIAQNNAGITYGNEMSFTTTRGKISGHVIDAKGSPIEFAKLMLKGKKIKISKIASSDADGLFEFADLDADTYVISAIKKGYKTVKQTATLEAGEEKDIEIVMKKTRKRVR